MDHLKRITDEFTRQAQTFAVWAEKVDTDVGSRFGSALGKAARGRLIDVACGPGVVTAALAPNAASVAAFDATEEMLEKAKARCAKAGVNNVEFKTGDAEDLPFPDGEFDGAVTRAALHHFADPQRAINEMFRVLRPGGVAIFADVISSEDAGESQLHNAIERLRDPSHVRMLPASELDGDARRAGFRDLEAAAWDMDRELEEWLAIVSDPARVEPIRTVIHALAEAGRGAGIGLSVKDGKVVFFHRWRFLKAVKPAAR
ncbi:MAG TPA: class I SAM-dependent methyltransferase [Xanthobacteraceae bacterium]|nr:class I SAM-dependent methyltransferase [Xanthobacteraceae bacterium]